MKIEGVDKAIDGVNLEIKNAETEIKYVEIQINACNEKMLYAISSEDKKLWFDEKSQLKQST